MQIISFSFTILKHIYLDWFIILKVIDAESPIVNFWGDKLLVEGKINCLSEFADIIFW